MALTDFLSNGQIPAGSAATSTTSQTVLPDWYTNYGMDLLSRQNAVAAMPYQTYQGPRVAEFTPEQQQGFGMTGQAATAYQPALTAATGTTQQALAAPGAMTAAQPFLNRAGQTTVENIGAYMNPYTENVVNRIGQLASRNLTENIMPGIEGRYIAAGQLGYGARAPGGGSTPSGMMTETARAIRDTQEATLAQQAAALQAGYGEAAGLSAADLARQAGLAGTAGNLATAQTGQQLSGASQLAELGGLAQKYGLEGAGAITGVGAQGQALNQRNLDTAYADFLRQQGYPQEQIDAALKTAAGVAPMVPTAKTEEGIVPLGYQPEYAPSTAATIGGTLLTAANVLGGTSSNSALGKLLGLGG